MKTKAEMLKCNRRVSWLKPMFEELELVINEYVDWEGEPPYWNNENASTSMLVAAGARAGYVVLSDYRTDKKEGRRKILGRCDLYIGKADTEWGLEVEAKPIYIRPAHGVEKITRAMDGKKGALTNARCLVPQEEISRAGLVFATMSVIPNKSGGWEKDLNELLKIFRSVRADLCWVWHDANGRRGNRWDTEIYRWQKEHRSHPGLAIFLKVCPN